MRRRRGGRDSRWYMCGSGERSVGDAEGGEMELARRGGRSFFGSATMGGLDN